MQAFWRQTWHDNNASWSDMASDKTELPEYNGMFVVRNILDLTQLRLLTLHLLYYVWFPYNAPCMVFTHKPKPAMFVIMMRIRAGFCQKWSIRLLIYSICRHDIVFSNLQLIDDMYGIVWRTCVPVLVKVCLH